MTFDTYGLVTIAITFFLAGGIKGVIGLGLPLISLGVLTAAFDLTTAMALIIVPAFVTNVWQAVVGGNGLVIIKRLWPFLCLATITIWLGAIALTTINTLYLSMLLGALLLAYASLNFFGLRFTIVPKHEKWSGFFMGIANGFLTGMTGAFAMPGVIYLQAIGLPRDMLVQAMGMLFLLSTVGLTIALQSNNLLSSELTTISVFAVVPALLGMTIGQRIRKLLSEQKFKTVVSVSIFVLGAFIIIKAYSSVH
ncbi:MAG: putative membrane protein YfcA [Gammaproteobacteria bacterium]|jgi:uncharacterized membrane protein YfcA